MADKAKRGRLVVIEGIDGTGKSTQATLLAERLRELGVDVVHSREPTFGAHGRRIRESALAGRMAPEDEADAFIADRREHVAEVIGPALAAGKVVVLDRYYFSTAAYQGARGLDFDEIIARNEAFAPQPDLLVVIDLPAAEGVARVTGRGDRPNLFEQAEELARCAALFARIDKPYLLRIDGRLPIAEIHERIVAAVRDLL